MKHGIRFWPLLLSIIVLLFYSSASGQQLSANLTATASTGASDNQAILGMDPSATDGYDIGIDQFEPPTPPGNYIRAYFEHPEWGQILNEYSADIRSPFSKSFKDWIMTIEANHSPEVVLSHADIDNPSLYAISLLDSNENVLVPNLLADSYVFTASVGKTNFIIRVSDEDGYLCGDANNDGSVNVSDCVWMLNYIFEPGSPPPQPMESGEVNCDGTFNVSDVVWLLNYVFVPGSPGPCECK